MAAAVVQADYDRLEEIANRFGQQATQATQIRDSIARALRPLQESWKGEGSGAFLGEMNGVVFPVLFRLEDAFISAQTVVSQIIAIMQASETEAAQLFADWGIEGLGVRGGVGSAPGGVFASPPNGNPGLVNVRDSSRDTSGWFNLWTNEYWYTPTYEKFPGSVSPDGISPTDVKQGSIGDCYYMAALASIAQQNPDAIKNAIKDNGDGTYTVTFYKDGKPVLVTVDNEFPIRENSKGPVSGNPAYAQYGSSKDELWPMIMEKAYAKHMENSYKDIEGGWPENAVESITGKPGQKLDLGAESADDQKATLKDIESRLSNGEYLTAATRDDGIFEDESKWPNNVVPTHAYAVERVDVEKGLIYLRNPWGSTYNPQPMTLDQFNEYYSYMAANK